MYARVSKAYKKVHLESASKERILDELYGRLLRDCSDARAAIEKRHVVAKSEAINHAMSIVNELVAALDYDAFPELCENLGRLYDFVNDRLLEGSQRLETAPIEEAEHIVASLRASFQEAVRNR